MEVRCSFEFYDTVMALPLLFHGASTIFSWRLYDGP